MSAKKKKRDKKKKGPPAKPQLPQGLAGRNVVLFTDLPVKMSEVLEEFIEPYMGQWKTLDDLSKLLNVAAIAWNMALAPAKERETSIQEMMEKVPSDARAGLREVIEEMVRRKLAHFASNRRMIVGVTVTPGRKGPYIQVASTPGNV